MEHFAEVLRLTYVEIRDRRQKLTGVFTHCPERVEYEVYLDSPDENMRILVCETHTELWRNDRRAKIVGLPENHPDTNLECAHGIFHD